MNRKIIVVFFLVLVALCIDANGDHEDRGLHCPRKAVVGSSKVDKCQSDSQCTGAQNLCCTNPFGYHECATGTTIPPYE